MKKKVERRRKLFLTELAGRARVRGEKKDFLYSRQHSLVSSFTARAKESGLLPFFSFFLPLFLFSSLFSCLVSAPLHRRLGVLVSAVASASLFEPERKVSSSSCLSLLFVRSLFTVYYPSFLFVYLCLWQRSHLFFLSASFLCLSSLSFLSYRCVLEGTEETCLFLFLLFLLSNLLSRNRRQEFFPFSIHHQSPPFFLQASLLIRLSPRPLSFALLCFFILPCSHLSLPLFSSLCTAVGSGVSFCYAWFLC